MLLSNFSLTYPWIWLVLFLNLKFGVTFSLKWCEGRCRHYVANAPTLQPNTVWKEMGAYLTHLAFPASTTSKTQQRTSTLSESTDANLSHALPQPRPRGKEWALKWDIKIHVFDTECICTFQCLISVKGHFALLNYNVLFSLPSEIQDFHLRLPSVTIVLGYKKRKLKNCGNINCFIQT